MNAKVVVHVNHGGAKAARNTRVAQMATSRRSTLPWFAGIGNGLGAFPVATAIDHIELLTDEVKDKPRPVVVETTAPRRGAPFFLSELLSPIPKNVLMQTQAGECVEMVDLHAARQF